MTTPTPRRPRLLARWLATNRRHAALRGLASFARRYLQHYGNLNYDIESNGEVFVLSTLAAFDPKFVFDVGANRGDWTLAAHAQLPHASIHAFEIAKPTFDTLAARTASLQRVSCHNVGLSDAERATTIRYCEAVPELTTVTEYPHPFEFTELAARTVRGDDHALRHRIGHIDLLKIDVEGMEEPVLRGFERLFTERAIDVVQFEYGQVSILTRFLLRDFHNFFRERGYAVGKVYPDYVDFREYDMADEDFLGPNYLACRNDLPQLLRAFGGAKSP